MKRLIPLFSLLLLALCRAGAAPIDAGSKVTGVTVYRNMARETRTSDLVTLPQGESEVVLTDISMAMLDQSLQVAVKGSAVLLTAEVRTNYFSDNATPPDPRIRKLQDSIDVLNRTLRWVAEEIKIAEGEVYFLDPLLKSAGTQKDYKPTDLNAVAEIYHARMPELLKKIFDLKIKKEDMEARLNRHRNQINEMGPRKKDPVKEVVLRFYNELPGANQVKVNYLVQSAGWTPSYDLTVASTSKPVNINYKANVFQATGRDWAGVDMYISTSNPSMNNDRPIMNPRYVDYTSYALSNMSTSGAVTNMYMAQPVQEDSNVGVPVLPVTVIEAEVNVQYHIELKQTIAADGKPHICNIQEYNVPATYRYHAVPKLDAGAFLLARITEYGQYNMLPGRANVFFEDNYVGQVDLNPAVTGDTMLVSLGRDERIVVNRARIAEKTKKEVLSGQQKENVAWCITVRNNKGVPIVIDILDQIPLSRRQEIKVKLEDKGGAVYEETLGKLQWQLKLDPNKTKKIEFVYTLEYPAGRTVGEQ